MANRLAIAQLLLSITLGFITQRSLAGNADIAAHTAAQIALAGPTGPAR